LLKTVLAVLLVAAYAISSHLALILPDGKTIAAVLAVGIPAAIASAWVFQWVLNSLERSNKQSWHGVVRFSLAGIVAVMPIFGFLYMTWPLMLANADAVYFVQHVGTNALLAWVFGRTLVGGSTPLIVTFAKMIHPTLPKDIENYARKVTIAWVWFFVATCLISVMLYFLAPLAAWSSFAILWQWPSVVVFFIGEYVLRKKLFKTTNRVKYLLKGRETIRSIRYDCAFSSQTVNRYSCV
jgi:uncharacterized membrane protein